MDLAQWPTNRLLATAARLTETTESNQFRDLGITQAGFTALRVLSQGHSLSKAELARRLRVRPETLGKVIDRLEHTGLIVRGRSAPDERDVRLRITRDGRTLLARADAVEEEQERTLGSDKQLRAELINRIRALGLDSGPDPARPALKLVREGDRDEGGGESRSSAAG